MKPSCSYCSPFKIIFRHISWPGPALMFRVSGDEVHASPASCPTQRSPGSPSQPLGRHPRWRDPRGPLGQHALRAARPGAQAGDQASAQRVRSCRGPPPSHAPPQRLAAPSDRGLPRDGDQLRHQQSLTCTRPPTPGIRHEW